jgi:hypothetical protein
MDGGAEPHATIREAMNFLQAEAIAVPAAVNQAPARCAEVNCQKASIRGHGCVSRTLRLCAVPDYTSARQSTSEDWNSPNLGNSATPPRIIQTLGQSQKRDLIEIAILCPSIRGSGGSVGHPVCWGRRGSVHLNLLFAIDAGSRGARTFPFCTRNYRDNLFWRELFAGLRARAIPSATQ